MMKRTLPALLLVLLLLTGCGASSSNMSTTESAPQESYDYGWLENGASQDSKEEPDTAGAATNLSGALDNAKMIYTADVTLQTKEYDSALEALNALVRELGGYFESRELDQGSSYRSLYCVVRVPAEQFTPFLDRSGTIANMTYRNEYSENVSEAYYDLESRLVTQRTKLDRLQELLAKAESMEDIITIESAISETELTIEQLTGSLRHYDSLVDYATIRVSLHEVYRLSTEEETPVTFGDRLATAFRRGLTSGIDNLEDCMVFIARNWLTLLFWIAAIAAAVAVLRHRHRTFRGLQKPKEPKPENTHNDTPKQ